MLWQTPVISESQVSGALHTLSSSNSHPRQGSRHSRRSLKHRAQGNAPTWLDNASAPDLPSGTSATAVTRPPPWTLSFDLRERETDWTDENKVSDSAVARVAHTEVAADIAAMERVTISLACACIIESVQNFLCCICLRIQ